jgi:AcrR family transcriptional regulator
MTLRRRDATSTRQRILQAARAVLSRDGSGGLSTRAVAVEAGINLSLIHYYFSSRDGLLLAVLEDINADLLDRQREMYLRSDIGLADKWRQAVEFYRQDLASGYVRILLELAAHGFSNPEMAECVRSMMRGWRDLLADVAAEALERYGIEAVKPIEVASLIVSFWWGMELQHLLGVSEQEGHLWQALATLGDLLERLEQQES